MRKRQFLIFCIVLFILPMIVTSSRAQEESGEDAGECCFSRAGYQGICVVEPGEDETCESILNYLNTVGTIGKTYCGASKLRGGWKSVECPEDVEQ